MFMVYCCILHNPKPETLVSSPLYGCKEYKPKIKSEDQYFYDKIYEQTNTDGVDWVNLQSWPITGAFSGEKVWTTLAYF
jgi:hypothetical protein